MNITDELRKYVQDWRETPNLMDDLDAGDVSGILADFENIAVSIEAEHEKAMSRAGQLLADAEHDRDCYYLNWQDCKQKLLQRSITADELEAKIECLEDELSHSIELPKDADGEYIHIGDRVENNELVVRIVLTDGSWEPSVYIEKLPNVLHEHFCNEVSHYNEPTVEDMLREFVSEFNRDDTELCDEEIIERFAAKLRLAGDAS